MTSFHAKRTHKGTISSEIFDHTFQASEEYTSHTINIGSSRHIGIYGQWKTTAKPTITFGRDELATYNDMKLAISIGTASVEEYTFVSDATTFESAVGLSGVDANVTAIAAHVVLAINNVQGSYVTATSALGVVTLTQRVGDPPLIFDGTALTTDLVYSGNKMDSLHMLVNKSTKGTFYPYTQTSWEFDALGNIGFVLSDVPFEHIQFSTKNNAATARELTLFIDLPYY